MDLTTDEVLFGGLAIVGLVLLIAFTWWPGIFIFALGAFNLVGHDFS